MEIQTRVALTEIWLRDDLGGLRAALPVPRVRVPAGDRGALRAGASLVTVDVLTGHICSISFCLYVPTERDKYVWLVQSRRRPEKWTRTRKEGSRGSATPDPVS